MTSPPPRHPSGGAPALAWLGGFALVVIVGLAIAFLVLRLSNSPSDSGPPENQPLPTVTVTANPDDGIPPQIQSPTATVTVTQQAPWPVGLWSPGSPCLIPYPGLELGLEYGYTQDQTIKSWVYGVQELIQRLWERGLSESPPGPIDGEYGAKTEAGVLGFQRIYGERQTGRVDAATWASLRNQCERFR